MIRRLILLAIASATAALVGGFLLSQAYYGVFASLLVGLAWAVSVWQNWTWAASPGLVLLTILAVVGAAQEYYAILDAFAVAAALFAWDLSRFELRLKMAENDPPWNDAARRHVQRLLWVIGVGLIITILAISLQVGGVFFLAWFLAIGAIVALFVLIIWMAKLTQ